VILCLAMIQSQKKLRAERGVKPTRRQEVHSQPESTFSLRLG